MERERSPLPIPNGVSQAMTRMHKVDPENVIADIMCAIDHGKKESLYVMGTLSFWELLWWKIVVKATAQTKIHGLATWHGGDLLSVLPSSDLENVHVEMDFGEIDPLIPLSDVEKK